MKNTSKRQPYNPIGPFTQAEMLALKAKQPSTQTHIFKPWKTGKTYPYRSTKRMAA